MARARNIKPSFFTSEQLASCSPLARLLFAGLWTICDRAGKCRDRPRKIKAELMPYEAAPDADAWLEELAHAGLLLRYEVAGERFLKVVEFVKHQKPHPKEPPSEIPEPCLSMVEPGKNTEGIPPSLIPHPLSPLPATEVVAEHGGLAEVASALGKQFMFTQPLGLGKDPDRTRREFARWLLAVGPQETAMECLRLANEKGERPRHLSWFVGWLSTVPDSKLRRAPQ